MLLFHWFWKCGSPRTMEIVSPRNWNVCISIGFAHDMCVFCSFLMDRWKIILYIVQREIENMVISIGSGRGVFQRTYKNNGRTNGTKLKLLFLRQKVILNLSAVHNIADPAKKKPPNKDRLTINSWHNYLIHWLIA